MRAFFAVFGVVLVTFGAGLAAGGMGIVFVMIMHFGQFPPGEVKGLEQLIWVVGIGLVCLGVAFSALGSGFWGRHIINEL